MFRAGQLRSPQRFRSMVPTTTQASGSSRSARKPVETGRRRASRRDHIDPPRWRDNSSMARSASSPSTSRSPASARRLPSLIEVTRSSRNFEPFSWLVPKLSYPIDDRNPGSMILFVSEHLTEIGVANVFETGKHFRGGQLVIPVHDP